MGWDTHRLWELLFFGTVPIILATPLEPLLVDAHLPVIIVKKWKDVCTITDEEYTAYSQRYEHWIANVLLWCGSRLPPAPHHTRTHACTHMLCTLLR